MLDAILLYEHLGRFLQDLRVGLGLQDAHVVGILQQLAQSCHLQVRMMIMMIVVVVVVSMFSSSRHP